MAQSMPSLGDSRLIGSDHLPDSYCEPCYEASNIVKIVAGHCQNCDENLCRECFTSHCGLKLFRSHKLVKKSARPSLKQTTKNWFNNKVREYMPTVALVIVAIVITSILNSHNEEMAKLNKTIQDSQDVRNFKDVVNDAMKLMDEFVDLITKTEKQTDNAKREDFTKIEKIVMKHINTMTVQLETLKENNKNESLLTVMKHAQDQLKSLVEKLNKLDKDNTIKKVKAIQKVKRPIHVKDIMVTPSPDKPIRLLGSLLLPNKQILITDHGNKKLKLIDTHLDKIISQVQLSGYPLYITKVREDEVAVSIEGPTYTIQFIFISKNSMSKVREFKCDGRCEGIVYNDRDHTLIVTFVLPPKVKILDMAGNEIKTMRDDRFSVPIRVALTPDMTNIYVTDFIKHSVTLLSLNGDVKAVYKDKTLSYPIDVYVHTSGLVYVVSDWSHTVHELDPESGEFRVLLEKKDGLSHPRSISYCELEDKMYIGMLESSVLKMFHMSFDNRK